MLFLDISGALFEELCEHFGGVQLQAGQGKTFLALGASLVLDNKLLTHRSLIDLAAAVLKSPYSGLEPALSVQVALVVPPEENTIDYHSIFITHLSAINFIHRWSVCVLFWGVTEVAGPKPRSDHLIISKIYWNE